MAVIDVSSFPMISDRQGCIDPAVNDCLVVLDETGPMLECPHGLQTLPALSVRNVGERFESRFAECFFRKRFIINESACAVDFGKSLADM